MPWPRCGTHQPAPRWPLWLISFLTLACVLILLLLNWVPSERFTSNHLFLDALRPHASHPTNDPSAGTTEFYQWHTTSSFHPVNFPNAKSLSTDTLCAAFPPAILDSIQPVFKTGHALLGDRVRAHLQTVSACLPELLIFSDADDTFHGHHVIDIIADIPAHLPHVWDHRENQWEPYEQLHALLANGTLDQVDASTLQGWKTDKFKFLPGISRAWRMRPGKEWYVFFEDDTYIMWDSLFRMLGELDPDAPWYLGDPSPGRKPDPDSPKVWFANGGPGYILSRAAMQILVRDDYHPRTGDYLGTRLTEKWWEPETLTNCCGDSILGWVLWNEGVNVSGIWPMISTERPAKIPYTRKYWCKPVVSMHRVVGNEMLDLWHWEWENRKPDRPILYRDLAMSYLGFHDLSPRVNWDNTGRGTHNAPPESEHYHHDPNASFEACGTACEATPACMQYSYRLRTCKFNHALVYGEERAPELGRLWDDILPEESRMEWTEDEMTFRAGWVEDTVADWLGNERCESVEWVRPSIERVD